MSKNQIEKEYREHRTSWKFFDRLANRENGERLFAPVNAGIGRVLIEILKELQYLNDRKEKVREPKLLTTADNVLHPFNKNHIAEVEAMAKKRGVKCVECKSEKVKFKQFSPDIGTLYFCSMAHFKEFQSDNIYRALPLEKIKK